MPWKIFKENGEYCVYKHDEQGRKVGDTLGCHPTRAEAEAQLRALHANVKEGEAPTEISEAASMVVQTVIIFKEIAETRAEAIKKVPSGLKTDEIEETEQSWRFRQRDPGDFDETTFRTKEISPGVALVMGKLKRAQESQRPVAPTQTQVLVEALDLTEAQIDNETQTVRQRIIRAGRSTNGRVYTPEVLQRALPLFEGVKTFADHPSGTERRDRPERSVRQITGWLSNVEYREDGIYAVRHFTSNQAGQDTWALVRDIVEGRAPATLLGGSINAIGRARKTEEGDLIVESIEAVHSVDDVTSPAAGGGFLPLWASNDDLTADLLKALTFEEYIAARPEFVERLKREWQAVRQTEAVAAAIRERDQARSALIEAQKQAQAEAARVTALEAEVARLRTEMERKGYEVELEKAFRRAALPAVIESELREEIARSEPSQWAAIVERGSRLMAAVGKSSAPVSGAPRMVTEIQSVSPGLGPINVDEIRSVDEFIAEIRKRQQGGQRLWQ